MKKQVTLTSRFDVYDSINELNETDRKVLENAIKAKENAYAPYSNFKVGAAVLLENGEIITGNNQENAAYPSGLCAERVAMFYTAAKFPDKKIVSIAISAASLIKNVKKPISPCGACRQVMAEYEVKLKNPIRLILANDDGLIHTCASVVDLLPLMFSADNLI